MKFGSVCSGIEAASVAWEPLGWQAQFVSEIEPFPCSVLAHHWPSVPNHGDMTKYKEWDNANIDVLVGGTPCQSFSVAGLRKGLDDPRGNLMLTFGAIAAKYQPQWLVWENVPGVLSANGGRDFGTFLGMLGQLGYGFAYRVLDAQYFGVAQRRRRVFVVGHLGDWRHAAAVLFERHSLSGNPAPSRQAREEVTGTLSSRTSAGGGLGTDFECAGGLTAWPAAVASTLDTTFGAKFGQDNQHVNGGCPLFVPAISPCLETQVGGLRGPDTQACAVVPSLTASMKTPLGNGGKDSFVVPVSVHGTQDPIVATDRAHALGRNSGQENAVLSVALRGREGGATAELGDDVAGCLRASSGGGDKPHVLAPVAGDCLTPFLPQRVRIHSADGVAPTLSADEGRGHGVPSIFPGSAVRRLTPVECERLQGFPDGHTQVPHRGKPAADGPRYKALGNSMAVPVMRWIGERIQLVSDLTA